MLTDKELELFAESVVPDPALDPALDQLSRRTLLTRIGAGAAGTLAATLGAEPAADAAPKPEIVRSDITFESKRDDATAQVKAFLASPKTDHKRGGVIVVHEIFGLTDHIKSVAVKLAEAGYDALAADFFSNSGPLPDIKGDFKPLMEYVSAIPDSQIMQDASGAAKTLRALPRSNGKVGIVGFCWGGRISMLFDAASPDLNAAVAYYGRISGDKTANQPQYPIDAADKMNAPLLGHFGAEDKGIPPSEVEKLSAALKAAHKKAELHEYEKAGHAFNNDTRESYRPEAAKLAWKRTLDWYHKYLG